MTRVVFMGSPHMALPSLQALRMHPGVQLVGVFAQPDKPAGRHRHLQPCPVKAQAVDWGLPVLTPDKAGGPEAMDTLARWAPELVVVCAYGRLLPQRVLDVPPLGCYNLHFSMLPRWRGASPIQAAILAGDATTAVSLQRMVKDLDAGPLAAWSDPLPIAPQDTAHSLGERLAHRSAELLTQALPLLLGGQPPLTPQDPAGITHCHIIAKGDGAVDWAVEDAAAIARKCRAFTPWPGCFGFWAGHRLGLVQVEDAGMAPADAPPQPSPLGTLLPSGLVPAHKGYVRLLTVKPEGKTAMSFQAFLNGYPQALGQVLTPRALLL